eukprot:4713082-Prymnesium_polylepis.1
MPRKGRSRPNGVFSAAGRRSGLSGAGCASGCDVAGCSTLACNVGCADADSSMLSSDIVVKSR